MTCQLRMPSSNSIRTGFTLVITSKYPGKDFMVLMIEK